MTGALAAGGPRAKASDAARDPQVEIGRGARRRRWDSVCTKIYSLVVLGFGPVFGQTWAQENAQRPRLEKRYINQRKIEREIDSKAPRKLKYKIWPLSYAMVLPGRKSAFRAGFCPDGHRESTEIGPPAGRRLAGLPKIVGLGV